MTDPTAPWATVTIGAFAAQVAADRQGQRVLAITTPDGVCHQYVFTPENAETIGRQLLAPGVHVPDFPPDR